MAQCTAHAKSTNKQCTRMAIVGGTVCYVHGGAAPQVKRAALERIQEARDLSLQKFTEYVEAGAVDPRTTLDATTRLTELSETLSGRPSSRGVMNVNVKRDSTDDDIETLLAELAARKEAGAEGEAS